MKRHSTSTLMGMTKKQLIEYVRMAEHNEETAMAALEQQAENVKDWEPINPELRRAVKLLRVKRDLAKRLRSIFSPEDWEKVRTMFPLLRDYWEVEL